MAEIKGRALTLMDMVFDSDISPSSPTSTFGSQVIDEIQQHEEVIQRSKEDWLTTQPQPTNPTW
jgi:ABC-type microcin C transport system duplicated ATPase subunit YejF